MKDKPKNKILKRIIIILSVLVSVALLAVLIYPLIIAMFQDDASDVLAEKLESFGIWTPFLFLLLQIIQIVIAFIPGEPIPAIGAILFGEIPASLLCLLGCFLGTVIVYYLVQRFGRPIAEHFVPEKYFEKYTSILSGKKLYWIIFIIFLLPGLPKDVLTYLVALHPTLEPKRFFALTTIGRAPAIVMTVYLGKNLWNGNIKAAVIILLVLTVLLAVGILAKKWIERERKK